MSRFGGSPSPEPTSPSNPLAELVAESFSNDELVHTKPPSRSQLGCAGRARRMSSRTSSVKSTVSELVRGFWHANSGQWTGNSKDSRQRTHRHRVHRIPVRQVGSRDRGDRRWMLGLRRRSAFLLVESAGCEISFSAGDGSRVAGARGFFPAGGEERFEGF
jgi:hypothetical protein